jgi:phosphonate transport system permease protein
MRALFAEARRERSAIAARHPRSFRPLVYRLAVPFALLATMLALAGYAVVRLEFSLARIAGGLGKLAHLLSLMLPPAPGPHPMVFVRALEETLSIAFLGTLAAAVLAFPLGLLAAQTLVRHRLVHGLVRRLLDVLRGIDVLIWALIFVNVVGLGPFAGILAIAASDCGTLGKLFSEAIETADRAPVDAVVSTGGSRLHVVRLALLPGLVPVLASQVLYYFESNTRSATIIGIVGAGGIGLHLAEEIRVLEWQRVSFLILMILVTVMVIDWISTRLRLAMIGRR